MNIYYNIGYTLLILGAGVVGIYFLKWFWLNRVLPKDIDEEKVNFIENKFRNRGIEIIPELERFISMKPQSQTNPNPIVNNPNEDEEVNMIFEYIMRKILEGYDIKTIKKYLKNFDKKKVKKAIKKVRRMKK